MGILQRQGSSACGSSSKVSAAEHEMIMNRQRRGRQSDMFTFG